MEKEHTEQITKPQRFKKNIFMWTIIFVIGLGIYVFFNVDFTKTNYLGEPQNNNKNESHEDDKTNNTNEPINIKDTIRAGNELLGYINIPKALKDISHVYGDDPNSIHYSDGNYRDLSKLFTYSNFHITLLTDNTIDGFKQHQRSLFDYFSHIEITYDGPFTAKNVSGHKFTYNSVDYNPDGHYNGKYVFEINRKRIVISWSSPDPNFFPDNLIDTYRFEN